MKLPLYEAVVTVAPCQNKSAAGNILQGFTLDCQDLTSLDGHLGFGLSTIFGLFALGIISTVDNRTIQTWLL